MSIRAACPGCMSGHHDQHVRDWNIRPGLIGGAWCDCPGDPECTWKFEEFAKRMLRDVGLPTTDEPTCEPRKLCEHGWNRAHNELVGPGQLTKVPCPGPTDDERGVAVNASEADRSALFIADDADGDATLWRPNGDYPVPLIRRYDCPPEVWTILAAALADPGGPQADRLRCCPECGFDNNEHNDGCFVAAASPTPENRKPE